MSSSEKISWENLGSGEKTKDSLGVVYEDFDVEKAELERNVRRATKDIIDYYGGFQEFCDDRVNGRIDDEEEEKYLRGTYRPVDALKVGYKLDEGEDPFEKACQSRFNLDIAKMRGASVREETHYRRILGYFADNNMTYSELVDNGTYERFVKKYEAVMDFEKPSERFIDGLRNARDEKGNSNSEEKIDEYLSDMEKFKECLFGKQYYAFLAFQELNKMAEDHGRKEEENIKKYRLPTAKKEEDIHEEVMQVFDMRIGTVLENGHVIESESYSSKEKAFNAYRSTDGGYENAPGNTVEQAPDGRWYWVRSL